MSEEKNFSDADINMKLSNMEVELFYQKWASRLDTKEAVEFGEDLMAVIRAIGDSIIGLMKFTLNKDDAE